MAAPALSLESLENNPTLAAATVEDPDRLLVLRAQRELPGDSPAYRALVERHRSAVLCRAQGILGSWADAEEAVQEAFLSVFRALPAYRPHKPFVHWLSIIVLNVCRMLLRQRAREQRRREQFRLGADRSEVTSLLAHDPILRSVLNELMDELPAPTRAALWMRAVEDRPNHEIAKQLQMSESAVKMRISRGRTTLRKGFEERIGASAAALRDSVPRHVASR